MVEPNPFRRAEAERLGVIAMEPGDGIAERSRELSGHRDGADVAFECSGAATALPPLLDALRREGTVVTVGHPGRPVPIDVAAQINKRGITLCGIFGRRLWETREQTMLLLNSGRLADHTPTATEPDRRGHGSPDGDACKLLLAPEPG